MKKKIIFKKFQFYRRLRLIFFKMEVNEREYPDHLIVKINTVLIPLLLAEQAKEALKMANEIMDEWLIWRFKK